MRAIKGLGGEEIARSIRGKLTGYSQRSEVESAIAKWKSLLGEKLKSKEPRRMQKQVELKAIIFNQTISMTSKV